MQVIYNCIVGHSILGNQADLNETAQSLLNFGWVVYLPFNQIQVFVSGDDFSPEFLIEYLNLISADIDFLDEFQVHFLKPIFVKREMLFSFQLNLINPILNFLNRFRSYIDLIELLIQSLDEVEIKLNLFMDGVDDILLIISLIQQLGDIVINRFELLANVHSCDVVYFYIHVFEPFFEYLLN